MLAGRNRRSPSRTLKRGPKKKNFRRRSAFTQLKTTQNFALGGNSLRCPARIIPHHSSRRSRSVSDARASIPPSSARDTIHTAAETRTNSLWNVKLHRGASRRSLRSFVEKGRAAAGGVLTASRPERCRFARTPADLIRRSRTRRTRSSGRGL